MSASAPPHHFTTPDRPLTWLITGCSSGLGLALARHVLASGHRLVATSRNPARTPDLVREVETHPAAATGGHRWVALDVDDSKAAAALIQRLEDDDKIAIDVLVNNAGYAILQTVEHVTEAEARAEMETLYFGPLRLMQAVLPHLRRRRFGVIVYVSSGAGLEARPSMGLYGSAKAAGDALIKVLAMEVAQFNVRAFYVSLGAFRTSMATANLTGTVPLDPDYHGSVADQTMNFMAHGGSYDGGEGDPAKAARAIFEVAAAQGVGKGREAETLLPLGRDCAVRVREVRDKLDHALEVFGDVCNNVRVDE